MGLWGVVTGKIYRWNTAKREAFHLTCLKLASQPTDHPIWISARRGVFCVHMAAEAGLSQFLFEGGGKELYRAIVQFISPKSLNEIISCFVYNYFGTLYLQNPDKNDPDKNEAMWRFVSSALGMTTVVYQRPKEYCMRWVDLIGIGEQYALDGEVIYQMSQHTYFDTTDQQHLFRWFTLLRVVRNVALPKHSDPQTEDVLQAELTAQLQQAARRAN
jgi:hypothetical protein